MKNKTRQENLEVELAELRKKIMEIVGQEEFQKIIDTIKITEEIINTPDLEFYIDIR
ncbi:MAG: hypothetical protein ACTSWN_02390 [Promethearchaeota archaeon]